MTQITLSDDLAQRLEHYLQQSSQSLEDTFDVLLSGISLANPALLSIFTHDMRTPLASIMTSSDIIKTHHHLLSETQQQEHLTTIQMQVNVINDMIDNLVILQKYDVGTLLFEPRLGDVSDLCQTMINEINLRTYTSHNITFDADGGTSRGIFDPKLLRLALIQVLTNAVRYSPENSTIQVRCMNLPEQVLVNIIDEGMGIPAKEQEQVSKLFYRASNSQRIPGKGLGLAVVQRIMTLHDGDMTIESHINQGTTIGLAIPKPYEATAF